jgi:hypothetical protein
MVWMEGWDISRFPIRVWIAEAALSMQGGIYMHGCWMFNAVGGSHLLAMMLDEILY